MLKVEGKACRLPFQAVFSQRRPPGFFGDFLGDVCDGCCWVTVVANWSLGSLTSAGFVSPGAWLSWCRWRCAGRSHVRRS
jgi:hypothetical protein